jgi:uncharacterized coiled-coil protein SlyX
MSPTIGGQYAGYAGTQQTPEVAKETTVQSVNRQLVEKISILESMCSRLDTFADRLEPQPRATAGGDASKAPPISNDLQGLQQRLGQLGERLDWLGQTCNRLERIA